MREFRPGDAEFCFRVRSRAFIVDFVDELGPEAVATCVNAYLPSDYLRMAGELELFIVEEDGEPMTLTEKRAVEGWAADWGWVGLWASTISSLIVMGMVVHAFITDRKMWGVVNFVFGFTAIPYMFMYVEKPLAVRFGMFLGACSPVPVFFALFSRLVATV